MGIAADEDAEVAELYLMYHFCKKFNCSPREFENLPYKQSQWLVQIDNIYEEAVAELREKAQP